MDHVLDILENKRFYAANFLELNDPMEGSFYVPEYMRHLSGNIQNQKKKLNICSFSRALDNLLLWAHYADNFQGICFEVEIKDNSLDFEFCKVKYSKGFPSIEGNPFADESKEIAKKVLSHKILNWKYEKEVRILTSERYVQNEVVIKSIFLGVRISRNVKWLFDKLPIDGIEVYETQIDGTVIKKNANEISFMPLGEVNNGKQYMSTIRVFRLPVALSKRLSDLARATQRSEDFCVKEALKYYFEDYVAARIAKDRFSNPSAKVVSSKNLRMRLGL